MSDFINRLQLQNATITVLAIALSLWLSTVFLPTIFASQSTFNSVDIRFKNIADIRVSDYIIREDEGEFLVAPNAPRELNLRLHFFESGVYSIHTKPQYPAWLCSESGLDKATVDSVGGSLRKKFPLIRGSEEQQKFTIAAGQSIKLSVSNKLENGCGRAIISFKKHANSAIASIALAVFWLSLIMVFMLFGASNIVVIYGLLVSAAVLSAEASLGPINATTVGFSSSIALSLCGLLVLLASLPKKSKLVSLFGTALILCYLSIPVAFIAYFKVFGLPIGEEAIHGLMQSYGDQAIEFWSEYIGYRRSLVILLMITIGYWAVHRVNASSKKKIATATLSTLLISFSLLTINSSALDSESVRLILKSALEYRAEIESFKKVRRARKNIAAEARR